MDKIIRIGTRESRLALWQANQVKIFLTEHLHHKTELVLIKSEGDINLTTPLYEVGVQGIFTKALDIALLENKIDVAVHSFKDVPIQPAKGLHVAAIMKRGNPLDVLVCKNEEAVKKVKTKLGLIIATSSIRRKAQWLHSYPGSTMENIRGNVNTRLEKLHHAEWHGAIFAAAGLDRLGLLDIESGKQILLDWMLPAPAQGAVALISREDSDLNPVFKLMNDKDTEICTTMEREFLSLLMGGCSTPIGGLATIDKEHVFFKGNITALDGSQTFEVAIKEKRQNYLQVAQAAVNELNSKEGVLGLLT